MNSPRFATITAFALVLTIQSSEIIAQALTSNERAAVRQAAANFLQTKLPSAIEIYVLENTDDSRQSLAARYEWTSTREWEDEIEETGTRDNATLRFDSGMRNIFVRGNYVRQEEMNPSEMSEIGATWARRWFRVSAENRLTSKEGDQVQQCMDNAHDFAVGPEECREQLGFMPLRLSYWYADVDLHAKIEGDQQFDKRHYVYGIETSLSRGFESQGVIANPILTVGIEQVDPKGDKVRDEFLVSDAIYDRAYAKVSFTGTFGRVAGQLITYSASYRYFKELNPELPIARSGLDSFGYAAIAVRVPAVLVPGLDNSRNSLVLTYAKGKLPFNRTSEATVELGFRHNVNLEEFF